MATGGLEISAAGGVIGHGCALPRLRFADRRYSQAIFIALRIRRPDSRSLSNFSERPPASSLPERFRHCPATITLSMLDRFACMITAETGSFIGCILMPLVEIKTRSACLPRFNDPI